MSALQKYILRRILYSFVTIFVIVFAVFTVSRMAGDPIEAYVTPETPPEIVEIIRVKYRLDQPIPVQFVYWLRGISQGDWGRAFSHGEEPVTELIGRYFPLTLELNLYGLLALPVGYWIGMKAAANKDTWIDHFARLLNIVGGALPSFFIGLLLLSYLYPKGLIVIDPRWDFARITGIPTLDAVLQRDWKGLVEAFKYLIGPLLTSLFGSLAANSRILRSSIIEEMGKDYIKTGMSKGLSKDYVDKKYARRNALIPFVTLLGYWFASMVTGTAILEAVFNRQGLGNVAAAAARATDHNTLQAFTLIYAVALVFANLLIDITYGYIDPRIKYGESK
jgi:peptide/nickel transport system permease protein